MSRLPILVSLPHGGLDVPAEVADLCALSPREIDMVGITLCLDGGALKESAPSTVLDPETGELIREGVVTRAQLAELRFP